MKSRVFAMLVCLVALTAGGAFAQGRAVLTADIPFAFHVGSKILPAGHYEVRSAISSNVLTIQCLECKATVVVPVMAVKADTMPQTDRLVFHMRGNAYFLSKVWTAGDTDGQLVP